MIKDNRWRSGKTYLEFPHLSPDLIPHGCGFYRLVLDPDVGEEVIVFLREDPPHAKRLAFVQPMTLIAHQGIADTPFGTAAYVVWQVAAGTEQEAFYETFLNPFEFGTLKLLSDVVNQTHLKFIAIDRSDQNVVSMIDYENQFELETLLCRMAKSIGHARPMDFGAATQFIMKNLTTQELVIGASIGVNI